MKRSTVGVMFGAAAAASYGMNPLSALPLFASGLKVNSVLFYRYLFAVIIYGLWLKFHKRICFKITREEFLPLLIMGLFFSFSSLTLFEAFNYIDAGIACTILFIYPALVAIMMMMFFHEKFSKTVLISIILIITGISMLYNGKPTESLSPYGVGMVISSALLYAMYIIGVKNIKTIRHLNSGKMSFYVMLFGLIVYIVNLKLCTELQPLTEPKMWLFTLALALLPTVISIETINIAIKLIGSTTAAILGALEPLTAIFFGVVVFHEQLTPKIVVGIIAVLTGVLLVIMRKRFVKNNP